MKPDQLKDSELDNLLRNVLLADSRLTIPSDLTDRTVRRIEKKVLIRNLILELFSKIALGTLSLAILAGVFVWIKGSGILAVSYKFFLGNWQMITALLIISFVTVFADQVGFRFYHTMKERSTFRV